MTEPLPVCKGLWDKERDGAGTELKFDIPYSLTALYKSPGEVKF
jgi:hypothetical protein